MVMQSRNGRVGAMNSDEGNPLMVGSLSFSPDQRRVNHTKTMNQVNEYAYSKEMMQSGGQNTQGMTGPYSQTLG